MQSLFYFTNKNPVGDESKAGLCRQSTKPLVF